MFCYIHILPPDEFLMKLADAYASHEISFDDIWYYTTFRQIFYFFIIKFYFFHRINTFFHYPIYVKNNMFFTFWFLFFHNNFLLNIKKITPPHFSDPDFSPRGLFAAVENLVWKYFIFFIYYLQSFHKITTFVLYIYLCKKQKSFLYSFLIFLFFHNNFSFVKKKNYSSPFFIAPDFSPELFFVFIIKTCAFINLQKTAGYNIRLFFISLFNKYNPSFIFKPLYHLHLNYH